MDLPFLSCHRLSVTAHTGSSAVQKKRSTRWGAALPLAIHGCLVGALLGSFGFRIFGSLHPSHACQAAGCFVAYLLVPAKCLIGWEGTIPRIRF